MEMNVSRSHMKIRLFVSAVALTGSIGCGLSDQSAPGLTGPSTLGRSVTVTASPDRIYFDGSAQATVTATVRKADGTTDAGVALRWEAVVIQVIGGTQTVTAIPVEPSPQVSTTGSGGTATTTVRAPLAPDLMPAGPVMLQVTAVTIGDDASTPTPGMDARRRSVNVELVPVLGPSAPDRLPVADFTISPPAANIFESVTFDASLTRDEGVVCGDRCSYVWEFTLQGGLIHRTGTGRIATTSFETAGNWNVKLYVTDERGFTGTKTQTLTVSAPAAPVANFFVSPSSPRVNQAATFNASTTTVGQGVNIASYVWDFGDGSPNGEGKTTTHTYTAVPTAPATAYTVVLTVTDDLGRISQKTLQIGVLP
jgi:PKD repeat protein